MELQRFKSSLMVISNSFHFTCSCFPYKALGVLLRGKSTESPVKIQLMADYTLVVAVIALQHDNRISNFYLLEQPGG